MFAPYYGIEEEAATGMGAGPLACYLFSNKIKKTEYLIEQGRFMKTPSVSLLKVRITCDEGKICALMAGGTATLQNTLTFSI